MKTPCAEHRERRGREDPDPWFPVTDGGNEATGIAHFAFAKRQCLELCPIVQQCGYEAIERDERYGVWGGMTPEERRRLTRKQGVA